MISLTQIMNLKPIILIPAVVLPILGFGFGINVLVGKPNLVQNSDTRVESTQGVQKKPTIQTSFDDIKSDNNFLPSIEQPKPELTSNENIVPVAQKSTQTNNTSNQSNNSNYTLDEEIIETITTTTTNTEPSSEPNNYELLVAHTYPNTNFKNMDIDGTVNFLSDIMLSSNTQESINQKSEPFQKELGAYYYNPVEFRSQDPVGFDLIDSAYQRLQSETYLNNQITVQN
jgi:hypothetical protein